jgi:hypothetical protein
MSRTWSSAAIETTCGSCGNRVKVGHPLQTITPHPDRVIKRKFFRCRLCADGTPPDDLPPPKSAQTAIKPTGQPSLPLQAGGDR